MPKVYKNDEEFYAARGAPQNRHKTGEPFYAPIKGEKFEPRQKITPQQEESTWEQLKRNTAQLPFELYSGIRTAGGLGDILQKIGALQPGGLINTREKARQEFQSQFPDPYYSQERPEDEWLKFLTQSVPQTLATGGASALYTLPFMYGGQKGTESLQDYLGNKGYSIGSEKERQELSDILPMLGGAGAGALGGLGHALLANRPTKALGPMAMSEEENIFNKQKSSEIGNLLKDQQNARFSFRQQMNDIREKYAPLIAEAKNAKDKARLKHLQGQEKLEIKHAQDLQKLEVQYTEKYAQAKPLENNQPLPMDDLFYAVEETRGKKTGMSIDAKKHLEALFKDIEDLLSDPNNPTKRVDPDIPGLPDTITTEQAKMIRQNINQNYWPGASSTERIRLKPIIEALDKIITEHNTPEHNQLYYEANKLFSEAAESKKKGAPELTVAEKEVTHGAMGEAGEKVTSLEKEMRGEENKIQDQLHQSERETKKALDKVERKTFEDHLRDKASQNRARSWIQKAYGAGAPLSSLIGLVTTAGGLAIGLPKAYLGGLGLVGGELLRQMKAANAVFSEYPQLQKKYAYTILDAAKGNTKGLATRTAMLGKELEKKADDMGLEFNFEPQEQLVKGSKKVFVK